MSDPERLTRRPPNTTTGALMRAGLAERPSEVSLHRTVKAVATFAGLESASSGAAAAAEVSRGAAAGAHGLSASPAAALATPAMLAKWFAIGAGSGMLLSLGVHQALAPAPRLSNSPTALVSAQRTPVGARASMPSTGPLPPATASESPLTSDAEPASGRRESATTSVLAVAPRGPTSGFGTQGASAAELAAEVVLVDRARALMGADNARGAIMALQGYEAQFPKQQLYTEVLAVRMEASQALGHEAAARSFATRLLERGVARPLADRARQLLAE